MDEGQENDMEEEVGTDEDQGFGTDEDQEFGTDEDQEFGTDEDGVGDMGGDMGDMVEEEDGVTYGEADQEGVMAREELLRRLDEMEASLVEGIEMMKRMLDVMM